MIPAHRRFAAEVRRSAHHVVIALSLLTSLAGAQASSTGYAAWGSIRITWQTLGALSSPAMNQELRCTISTPHAGATNYTFQWRVNGTPAATTTESAPGNARVNAPAAAGTKTECVVTPMGANGPLADPAIATVYTVNQPPSIGNVTLGPNPASYTSTLTCAPGTATDIEGDPIEYVYQWKVNGATIGATTSTLSAPAFAAGQTVSCQVTVRTPPTTNGNTVTSNTLSILGDRIHIADDGFSGGTTSATATGGNAACNTSGCTVDAGAATVTVRAFPSSTHRFVGWSGLCSGLPNPAVLTNPTQGGSCVANFETINRPPSIESVSLGPTPAYRTTPLVCTPVGANDPDGDPIQFDYRWIVNGVIGVGSNSNTLSVQAYTGPVVVQCEVTPRSPQGTLTSSYLTGPTRTSNQLITSIERIVVAATAGSGGATTATAVSGNPACSGSSCTVDAGASTVTLSATAANGRRFVRWNGCQAAQNPAVLVNPAAATTCEAIFAERVTIFAKAEAGGTASVFSTSRGANCSRTGDSCEVDAGSPATLTATANDGFLFVAWTGAGCPVRDAISTVTTTVTVVATATCQATFRRK